MIREFGNVVLVPFPFTDQTAAKKRPAVVVSSEAYQRQRPDLIVMAIASQLRPTSTVGEVAVVHWQVAGLLKPSVIKPLLTTIETTLVLRKLGQLHAEDQMALRQVLAARSVDTRGCCRSSRRHRHFLLRPGEARRSSFPPIRPRARSSPRVR